jgi:hypothetical protein
MKQKTKTQILLLTLCALVFGLTAVAAAQTEERGTIQGVVFADVNGDGLCVDTGVEGEEPVEGVDIEFVSSDEETVITLYSGEEGIYGLFAAGQSYWRVTAKPPAGWVVTSENPLYAPVFPEDGLAQTGYNFCVSGGTVSGGTISSGTGTNAVIILPESGAPATGGSGLVVVLGLIGTAFLVAGMGIGLRRRKQ